MGTIPTPDEVALLVLARTRDRSGLSGKFTATTKPTIEQVEGIITSVRTRVLGRIGPEFDTSRVLSEEGGLTITLADVMRETIAAGAAARVEASLEPESVSSADSAYSQLDQSYLEGLQVLVDSTTNDPADVQSFAAVSLVSPTLAAAARYPGCL